MAYCDGDENLWRGEGSTRDKSKLPSRTDTPHPSSTSISATIRDRPSGEQGWPRGEGEPLRNGLWPVTSRGSQTGSRPDRRVDAYPDMTKIFWLTAKFGSRAARGGSRVQGPRPGPPAFVIDASGGCVALGDQSTAVLWRDGSGQRLDGN